MPQSSRRDVIEACQVGFTGSFVLMALSDQGHAFEIRESAGRRTTEAVKSVPTALAWILEMAFDRLASTLGRVPSPEEAEILAKTLFCDTVNAPDLAPPPHQQIDTAVYWAARCTLAPSIASQSRIQYRAMKPALFTPPLLRAGDTVYLLENTNILRATVERVSIQDQMGWISAESIDAGMSEIFIIPHLRLETGRMMDLCLTRWEAQGQLAGSGVLKNTSTCRVFTSPAALRSHCMGLSTSMRTQAAVLEASVDVVTASA